MCSKSRATMVDDSISAVGEDPQLNIKNAFRCLSFRESRGRSRRWNEDSRLLTACVSKQAMCTDYELLNSSPVAWVWKDADLGNVVVAREPENRYTSTSGDRPSLTNWFKTVSRNGRSIRLKEESLQFKATKTTESGNAKTTKNGSKKKRFSWLPDADKRWPQGWC